jgi:tetratricopeptide (TPR) repeat protein
VRTISERIDEEWIQDLPTYSIEAYRAYARGREHLSAARWELAVDFFREAVAIDSTFVSAWVDLAASYWNLDRGDELDEAFARAMELRDRASARERIWLDLFGAVMAGDGPRIAQFASEMLESEPEHRFVRYLLGKGYYEQENWQESVEQWKPLREERWTWIWTYLYSSRALSHLEQFDEARRALHELDEILAPTDIYSRSRVQRYLGLAELDAGQADAALAAFQAVAAIDPEYRELLYDRGRVHLLAGGETEARADLESYLAMPEPGHFVSEAQALLNQMQ